MKELSLGFSCISFLYWIFLNGYTMLDKKDNLVWMTVILFFLLLWFVNLLYSKKKHIPLWTVVSMNTIAAVAIFVFIVIQVFMFTALNERNPENVDYLIVVGDRSNEIGKPSRNTRLKLDMVLDYLRGNPNTYIVLTGNQYEEQTYNIVSVMAKYLLDEGVSAEYLLVEMQASSLKENILYSNTIIRSQIQRNRRDFEANVAINAGPVFVAGEEKPISVGLIVNDCSVFRAKALAKRAGLRHFGMIVVESDLALYPHLMLKEAIFIFKDKFIGHI